MEIKNLKNPPITEALLDIRAEIPETTTLKTLEKFRTKVEKEFPNKQIKAEFEAKFEVKKSETFASHSSKPIGFLFRDKDNTKVVQARLNGFTFNKLKPYEGWDKFFKEGKQYWEYYREAASPSIVQRVALRYINRLDIPLPFGDFKEYIRTVPEIAEGLPQGLSDLLMKVTIPDEKRENTAVVTLSIDRNAFSEKVFPLILDINVFRVVNLPPSDGSLWKIIESLRDYKNLIFFKSLTKKSLDRFE